MHIDPPGFIVVVSQSPDFSVGFVFAIGVGLAVIDVIIGLVVGSV